jgi:AcrR family transcriptional regulator
MVGKQRHHRDDIILAAKQLFLEVGYGNASMDEIKNRVGISKGGLYHYFSTKELLLEAVIQSVTDDVVERLCQDLNDSALHGVALAQYIFDQQNMYKESYVELFGHLLAKGSEESARSIIRMIWATYRPVLEVLVQRTGTVSDTEVNERVNLLITLIVELTMRIAVAEMASMPQVSQLYEDMISHVLGLGNDRLTIVPHDRLTTILLIAKKIRNE